MLTVLAGNRLSAMTKPSSLPCAVSTLASGLPDVSIIHLFPVTSQHKSSPLTTLEQVPPHVRPASRSLAPVLQGRRADLSVAGSAESGDQEAPRDHEEQHERYGPGVARVAQD